MGWEHVIPQFALRLHRLGKRQPSGTLRFDIQGSGAGDAQLLLHRRPGRRRHGDARQRRASRHLSRRHHGRGGDCRAGAAHRARLPAARSSLFRARPPPGGTPRRCPDISKLAKLGYKPRVPLDAGPESHARLVLAQRRAGAEADDELTPCVPPKSRAPPAPAASVPVECCQVCGHAPLDDRALARLHAAGQPDGADRHACRASSRGFRPICCIAAIATWCSSAWRSIRSSSSRRNIPTPAAPPNCCATISPTCSARAPPCSASARTISWSTSAPTTARCCRTSRRRVPRARHRADRRRRHRQQPRHPDAQALFRRRGRARGAARAWAGERGHGRQLLCPHRGRARHRRRHRRDAERPTACSFPNRIISSRCSTRCNTTPSITSTCAIIRWRALSILLEMHDLEVFHARPIPSHGGSIRVYAARRGAHTVQDSVRRMLAEPNRAARR